MSSYIPSVPLHLSPLLQLSLVSWCPRPRGARRSSHGARTNARIGRMATGRGCHRNSAVNGRIGLATYLGQLGCAPLPGARPRRRSGFMLSRPNTELDCQNHHNSANSVLYLGICACEGAPVLGRHAIASQLAGTRDNATSCRPSRARIRRDRTERCNRCSVV